MSQQTIDISTPDDGLGDVLRTGFDKTNQNFTELYNGKVDKIAGKGLSENDFTDADKAKLDGIEAGAQVNVQADWGETDPLSDSFILNKPPSLYSAFGYFHYSDLDTQTTPLNFVASTPLQLVNDTLGVFTNEDQAPYGISSVWDKPTDSLDFSQLSVGDAVLFRADLSISTTSVNQNLQLYIKFGIGTPSEYDLLIDSWNEKNVVSFEHFIKDVSFSIDNTDWRDAPAKIYLLSDDDGSVKVNGWYIPIIRKSVNVLDLSVGAWSELTDFDALNDATLPLAGTEEIPIVQGGETKKVAVSEFGGSQNLQQVTDVGNTTTNPLFVEDSMTTDNSGVYSDSVFSTDNTDLLEIKKNLIRQINFSDTFSTAIKFRSRTQNTEFHFEDEGGTKSIATREWVALNGGSNVITEINTLGTVNTAVAETITYSLLIPANTISVGVYDCIFRSIRSSGSGSSTLKIYLNSSNSLIGASLVGQVPSTTTARYMALQRFVDVKVLDGSGLGTEVANLANSNTLSNDYVQHASVTGMGNIAIDWTNDVYLIATLTASVGTDVIRGTFLTLKK